MSYLDIDLFIIHISMVINMNIIGSICVLLENLKQLREFIDLVFNESLMHRYKMS